MEQALLNKIRDLYNFSEILSTTKVDKGFLSNNYEISTNDNKFFLKKYRFDDESRIKEIHAVKNYFSNGGIPVILPVKTSNEDTYFEYNDSYFALFPFVAGLQPERGTLSKQMIISLGKTLGKIHLLGKDVDLEINDYFNSWNKEIALNTARAVEEKLNQIENKSEFDFLATEVVALKKKLISQNEIKFEDLGLVGDHLIHGDYLDQNVFFGEQGEVKYVFDFEKTGFGPRTQELFRSATYSFLNTDFDEVSIENIKLYLKSYLKIYPMNKKELGDGLTAHYLKSIHGFWVEKEHYLKNNNRVDVFLELNFKRLKFMSKRLDDLL